MVAGIGIASPMPQTTMNTEQTYDSNQFQLGNNANPQEIRSNTANFNKFLGVPLSSFYLHSRQRHAAAEQIGCSMAQHSHQLVD